VTRYPVIKLERFERIATRIRHGNFVGDGASVSVTVPGTLPTARPTTIRAALHHGFTGVAAPGRLTYGMTAWVRTGRRLAIPSANRRPIARWPIGSELTVGTISTIKLRKGACSFAKPLTAIRLALRPSLSTAGSRAMALRHILSCDRRPDRRQFLRVFQELKGVRHGLRS